MEEADDWEADAPTYPLPTHGCSALECWSGDDSRYGAPKPVVGTPVHFVVDASQNSAMLRTPSHHKSPMDSGQKAPCIQSSHIRKAKVQKVEIRVRGGVPDFFLVSCHGKRCILVNVLKQMDP